MNIIGTLKKIRFQKENGWGTFSVAYEEDGKSTVGTFVGVLPSPCVGMRYQFEGNFDHHPTYGEQFKFTSTVAQESFTAEGTFALLTSSRFHGVGEKRARAIVDHFGDKTLDIIKSDPMRLTEIPGIGKTQAMNISNSMPDLGTWEQLRMLLKGSTDNAISKIYERYGNNAVSVIKKDPYTLINDIDGFGFIKADAIAAGLGITGSDPKRVRAAVYHCLDQAATMEGHCFSYATNLQANLSRLIPGVSLETIADAIKSLTEIKGRMRVHVDDDGAVYLAYLWYDEVRSAQIVKKMCGKTKPGIMYTKTMVDNAALRVELDTGICLDESQRDAVMKALNKQCSVITGGPGTGKTTIIRTMLAAIQQNEIKGRVLMEDYVALMAPTGRAARRMREATGFDNATTIHTAIRCGANTRSAAKGDPLPYRYIIVDESSMIDISLAARLLESLDPETTSIIFIGDFDQLPPIGPGVFFRDLIKAYCVQTVRLKFSFRQNGSIAQNANRINNGEGPHSYSCDDEFQMIPAKKEDGPEKAIAEYFRMVEQYGVSESVLLSPTRTRGEGGTNELNREIQHRLFPERNVNDTFATRDFAIGVGDRVMVTKNHIIDEHANGDVGVVTGIKGGLVKSVIVRFDGDSFETEIPTELAAGFLTLAFATTVHKSQGSEYDGVVVLFTTEHQFMGERGLIYTAVTRAKKQLSLVGDARAIASAVGKVKPITRNSKLAMRLNES